MVEKDFGNRFIEELSLGAIRIEQGVPSDGEIAFFAERYVPALQWYIGEVDRSSEGYVQALSDFKSTVKQ